MIALAGPVRHRRRRRRLDRHHFHRHLSPLLTPWRRICVNRHRPGLYGNERRTRPAPWASRSGHHSRTHSAASAPAQQFRVGASPPQGEFMSTLALSPNAAAVSDLAAPLCRPTFPEDVVEIGLLLPAEWAVALIELSRRRHESVGQLIRTFIGRALVENDTAV